jgi:hypothetical protein
MIRPRPILVDMEHPYRDRKWRCKMTARLTSRRGRRLRLSRPRPTPGLQRLEMLMSALLGAAGGACEARGAVLSFWLPFIFYPYRMLHINENGTRRHGGAASPSQRRGGCVGRADAVYGFE